MTMFNNAIPTMLIFFNNKNGTSYDLHTKLTAVSSPANHAVTRGVNTPSLARTLIWAALRKAR